MAQVKLSKIVINKFSNLKHVELYFDGFTSITGKLHSAAGENPDHSSPNYHFHWDFPIFRIAQHRWGHQVRLRSFWHSTEQGAVRRPGSQPGRQNLVSTFLRKPKNSQKTQLNSQNVRRGGRHPVRRSRGDFSQVNFRRQALVRGWRQDCVP